MERPLTIIRWDRPFPQAGRGKRRYPNTTGRRRGPRTVPSDHVTSAPASRWNSGICCEPFLQRDRDLHAGEVRPDAAVDAEAEGGVPVLRAVDHDAVGVRNISGSRLAAGNDSNTISPGLNGQPLIWVSFTTSRAIVTGA